VWRGLAARIAMVGLTRAFHARTTIFSGSIDAALYGAASEQTGREVWESEGWEGETGVASGISWRGRTRSNVYYRIQYRCSR